MMKNLVTKLSARVLPVFLVLLLSSCEQGPAKRKYVEILDLRPTQQVEKNSLQKMNQPLMDSVAQANIQWDVPAGWVEKKGGGMRVVSFVSDKYKNIDVSIVSLGGMAGGVDANITRWLGQLNLAELDAKVLSKWKNKIERVTSQGGHNLTLIDFTQLQKNNAKDSSSMMAAIANINGNTVFIKMMGPLNEVKQNQKSFRQLCASLK